MTSMMIMVMLKTAKLLWRLLEVPAVAREKTATTPNKSPCRLTILNIQAYQESARTPPLSMAKSEAYFFETIKENLPPKSYELLMKLAHIYMNCIYFSSRHHQLP